MAGGATLLAVPVLIGAAASGGTSSPSEPSVTAIQQIPATYLQLYANAAATCPGLSWTVLAAIGTVESDNGQSNAPGVRSGANSADAEGPMQFEPATFAAYDTPVPPGGARPPSPYDPVDAIYAAARLLCADGARDDRNLNGAVYAYNHSTAYVTQVLTLASSYGQAAPSTGSPAAAIAVSYAESQLGVPYQWGGEDPGVAFDCSGLAQAAYRTAGIALPRTAQQQYNSGPRVPRDAALQPGDLVFFGASRDDVTHVGIVLNPDGQMIDAPYTGTVVRVDSFPTTVGAAFGTDLYIGATRPADRSS